VQFFPVYFASAAIAASYSLYFSGGEAKFALIGEKSNKNYLTHIALLSSFLGIESKVAGRYEDVQGLDQGIF
jgi:hypothetical protein